MTQLSSRRSKSYTPHVEQLEDRRVMTIYVDPIGGSDNNSGTSESNAFQSFSNFVSYYDGLAPKNHVPLTPGERIVLMRGDHTGTYQYAGDYQSLFFRNVHGTADKPIVIEARPGARLNAKAPDGSEMSAIYLLQSSNIVVQGLDITSYGSAVMVAESTNVSIRNNYIHDVDGLAENNLAGVHVVGSQQTYIQDNFFVDNFDRKKPGNENNRHVVIFGSTEVVAAGNTMFNHDPHAGLGIEYKHLGSLPPNAQKSLTVVGNTIVNAFYISIGTSAPDSLIRGNLIIDSGPITIADRGGGHQLKDEVVEFNTIANTLEHQRTGALDYRPTEITGYPMGKVAFNRNLVVDLRAYSHLEANTIDIFRYGPDDMYQRSIGSGQFTADGNVYYANSSARFDVFGVNGGSRGSLGDVLSFDGWKELGFDQNGLQGDPKLDAQYQPTNLAAANAGRYASGTAKLSAILDRMTIGESGENSSTTLRLVRSGTPLDQPLRVKLSVSIPGQISIPGEAVIPAGSSTAVVTIHGLADQSAEPTMGVRIEASSDSFEPTSTWLQLNNSVTPPPTVCPPPPPQYIVDHVGVYRNGSFFLDLNKNGFEGEKPIGFGLAGDRPISGDWDGNDRAEVGVFRNGWFFLDTGVPGFTGEQPIQFGLPGDWPIAGDWDGDGKDDVGVFRGGDVYFDTGKHGYEGELPFQFGLPGDLPIAGNWAASVDAAMQSLFTPPASSAVNPSSRETGDTSSNPLSQLKKATAVVDDQIELSFSEVAKGKKVEFDPAGRISDGTNRLNSARVNLKVDQIAGRMSNNPTNVTILLYWSKSASPNDILSEAVSAPVSIHRDTARAGTIMPVYFAASKLTRQPAATTHLIARINPTPQLLAEESNQRDNVASQAIPSAASLAKQILQQTRNNQIQLATSHRRA